MNWLITPEAAAALEFAYSKELDTEAVAALEARNGDGDLNVVNGVAQIPITGVLTKQRDFFARFFGGGNTTYGEITKAIGQAEADPSIKSIEFVIDSPGGQTAGLVPTMERIAAIAKPTTALVTDVATSAAYGLAASTGRIIATNRAAVFGSIGVVANVLVNKDLVTVTSTEAPEKRPDPTTVEGQTSIRRQIDEVHDLFVGLIAQGRGVTASQVNENFGRGATMLAEQALEKGLIDEIQAVNIDTNKNRNSNSAKGAGEHMTLAELQAAHPDLYEQVKASGVSEERDRVSEHLILGQATGDPSSAIQAALAGDPCNGAARAGYMAAAMNKQTLADRADEDSAAAGADTNAEAPAEGGDVLALVEQYMGVTDA